VKELELPGWEKEDFVRFCEFAYRGDYTVPFVYSPGNEAEVKKSREELDLEDDKENHRIRSVRMKEDIKVALRTRVEDREYLPF